MTGSLYDTLRQLVRAELRRLRSAELAVVEESHPHSADSDHDNYACTVRLRDSGVILKQVPVATGRIGAVHVPASGDLVLVQFLGGDVNAPVVTGCLYNDQDRPPLNDVGKAVVHLPLGASDDEAVHVELASGEQRSLALSLGKGLALTLQDDDPVVELTVDGGKARLTIDRDGAVTLESKGKLGVKASEVGLKGDTVTIEASGELALKGAVINLN